MALNTASAEAGRREDENLLGDSIDLPDTLIVVDNRHPRLPDAEWNGPSCNEGSSGLAETCSVISFPCTRYSDGTQHLGKCCARSLNTRTFQNKMRSRFISPLTMTWDVSEVSINFSILNHTLQLAVCTKGAAV